MNITSKKIQHLNFPCKFQEDISFKSSSWFGTGGQCDVVFKAKNFDELSSIIKLLPIEIPRIAIGVTSNLLIRDEGFRGVIIKPRFLELQLLNENTIEVGSSVLDLNLAQFAAENNISGFEFFNTIPGTIGGAISMNSGCYGSEISDVLISADGVHKFTGEKRTFAKNEINFSYRHNPIQDYIWTKAILSGIKMQNNNEIYEKMERFYSQRVASQPKNCKTGGSTFCNPEGHKAWELIDKVGLRGHRIGGAHFSNQHCNFIINDQNGSANDIIALIELAEKRVFEEFNIKLKREIVII